MIIMEIYFNLFILVDLIMNYLIMVHVMFVGILRRIVMTTIFYLLFKINYWNGAKLISD